MAVDLSDLVDSLKREVNAPGIAQLPNATDPEYLGNLQDGFWEAVLDGVISGYIETDAIVTPSSGTTDLPREMQQLVVFYAGFRIVRNQMRDLKTAFKAAAGPVNYETQQSAIVLKSILEDLKIRRAFLLNTLSENGKIDAVYIDAFRERDDRMYITEVDWLR